jgi:hypothetical protein
VCFLTRTCLGTLAPSHGPRLPPHFTTPNIHAALEIYPLGTGPWRWRCFFQWRSRKALGDREEGADGAGEARAEMIRYQIRDEYGLADPELYAAPGEEDDPEALLEGVAMAGLVGVLRQLGDLAT